MTVITNLKKGTEMFSDLAGVRAAVRFVRWTLGPAVFFFLSFSTAYAAGWVSITPADGPDQDLCQALLDRLEHTDNRCILTAVEEYPGFTSPPWQALDPNQHIELVAKLLGYEGGPDTMTNQQWTAKLQGAKGFASAGGALKIWRTRLLTFFDSNGQFPVPAGDQTIVLMSRKLGISNCPTDTSYTQTQTFVVLPDLSGPDVRVDRGVGAGLVASLPMLYKARTLFVDNEVEYMNDSELTDRSYILIYQLAKKTGVHAPVCWFRYNGNSQNPEGN